MRFSFFTQNTFFIFDNLFVERLQLFLFIVKIFKILSRLKLLSNSSRYIKVFALKTMDLVVDIFCERR